MTVGGELRQDRRVGRRGAGRARCRSTRSGRRRCTRRCSPSLKVGNVPTPSALARSIMWSCVGPTNVPPRSDTSPPPRWWFHTRPPARRSASSTSTDLPGAPQLAGGGQARQPGADHDHVRAPRAPAPRARRRRPAARRPPLPRRPRPTVLCVSACSCDAPFDLASCRRWPATCFSTSGRRLLRSAARSPRRASSPGPPATSARAPATTWRSPRPAPCSPSSTPEEVAVVDLVGVARGRPARAHVRDRAAPRRLRALRRRRRRPHPPADRDRALVRRRRGAVRALRDAAPRRAGAGRALRDVRHAAARPGGARRAGGAGPRC